MNYDNSVREMKIEVIGIKEILGVGGDAIDQDNGILIGKKDRRDRGPQGV